MKLSLGTGLTGLPAGWKWGNGGGGGGGVAVAFGSEWRNSIGITDAAFRDGTIWPNRSGDLGNGAAAIIAADAALTGRGNIFRCYNAGANNQTVYHDAPVAEGVSHWGRCYFRDARTAGTHNHIIAIGGIGGEAIHTVPLGLTASAGGIYTFNKTLYDTAGGATGYPNQQWTTGTQGNGNFGSGELVTVTANVWRLVEWYVEWLSGTRYHLHWWMHGVDSAGLITVEDLFTGSTMFFQDYVGQLVGDLESIQVATGTYFGLGPTVGVSSRYVFGNEGPGGGSSNGEHFDLSSFGLSTEGRLRDQSLGLAA